jgi:hypothetical protein
MASFGDCWAEAMAGNKFGLTQISSITGVKLMPDET